MKTRARKTITWLILGAAVCLAAGPILAQTAPSAWDAPGADSGPPGGGRHGHRHRHGDGPRAERGEMPEQIRLHLELGRYYLLDQQYDSARQHFLAVAQMEPPAAATPSDRPRRGARMFTRARVRAYLMAAVSSVLAGDTQGGVSLAQEAQSLLPARPDDSTAPSADDDGTAAPERGNPLARFLDDPEGFSAQFAGGAPALEQRLLEIEGGVNENAQ